MSASQSTHQALKAVPAMGARHRQLEVHLALALLAASVIVAGCAGGPAHTNGTPDGASAGPSAPVPTLAPSPTVDSAGDAVIASFLAQAQAPDRSAHVEANGVVRFAGAEMTLATAYDLNGDDFLGTSTVKSSAFGTMTVATAVVDGVGYTRGGEADWTGTEKAQPPQDPLRDVVASDVEYAGRVDVDGSPGHRLLLRDPVGAFTRAMGVTSPQGVGSITPSDARFEVRVDEQGRPASATVSLRGTATTVGELEVGIEYVFSNWGSVGPIEPPITNPPTPDPGDVLTVYNRITGDIVVRDGNMVELPVPACGSASAATFDVSRFDILLASTGDIIHAEFPSEGSFVTRVALVGADFYQVQPGAYLGELPPCRDRVAQ